MDASNVALLSGSYFGLFQAFIFGILVSFTPCVYPLIPITLASFGASKEVSRSKAFLLALTFVLGIAVTYTSLGIVSAQSGAVFGQVLGNFWVILFLCSILVILTLSNLEVLELNFLSFLQQLGGKSFGQGFVAAFIAGTLSGLVAAPCAAPPLIAILSIAASSKSSLWGALLLLSYSLGFGLLFLALGTFRNLTNILPKSGPWLGGVKVALGVALMVVVFLLLQPLLPRETQSAIHESSRIAPALIGLFGLLFCYFSISDHRKWLRFPAATIVAYAIFAFVIFPPAMPGKGPAIWAPTIETAIEIAAKSDSTKLIMVDLYADWCVACKELEHNTFSNPDVATELQKLSLARVDFTTESDYTEAISKKFRLIGLPTLLFLKPDGSEIPGTRIEGFLGPKEFLEHLKMAALKKVAKQE